MLCLVGCSSMDNTVQRCIIANSRYDSLEAIKTAAQPAMLTSHEKIFANIHFIESPKGTQYSVKWFLNEVEVGEEMKETQNDRQDLLIFELEAENALPGRLKLEVRYHETVLQSQEIIIH